MVLAPGSQYKIETTTEGLKYSSSDPSVAIVSPDGVITALSNGTTIITVYDDEFHTAQITLTVQKLFVLGDVNEDSSVNAVDASDILLAAAMLGAGETSGLTEDMEKAADVNSDGEINALDAATVLVYSAAVGAGQEDAKLEEFIE